MNYRVFCQAAVPRVDFVKLVQQATRYFSASIDVLSESSFDPRSATPPQRTEVRLKLENKARSLSAEFMIAARHATSIDYDDAARAEIAGKAAGMSQLARRCPTLFEVQLTSGEFDDEAQAAMLNLCAILASAALGPVLPPDGSTLFGVRGAMERFERLLGASLSR